MAQSDYKKLRKELRRIGDRLEELTAACLGNNPPGDGQNTLMVGLYADIVDRFDGLEDSFAAVHDNTDGPSDDRKTIERLEEELAYERGQVKDMRDAK